MTRTLDDAVTLSRMHSDIVSALLKYDERQRRRPGYNSHAIALYLEALDDAEQGIVNGGTPRAELARCFCGRILDICLNAIGEGKSTDAEQRGAWHR